VSSFVAFAAFFVRAFFVGVLLWLLLLIAAVFV
jgi:hypothetical protein